MNDSIFCIFPSEIWCQIFENLNPNYLRLYKCISKDFYKLSSALLMDKRENKKLNIDHFWDFVKDFVDTKFVKFPKNDQEKNSEKHDFITEFHLSYWIRSDRRFIQNLYKKDYFCILKKLSEKNVICFTYLDAVFICKYGSLKTIEFFIQKHLSQFKFSECFERIISRADLSLIKLFHKNEIYSIDWKKHIHSWHQSKDWKNLFTWTMENLDLKLNAKLIHDAVTCGNLPLVKWMKEIQPTIFQCALKNPQLINSALWTNNIELLNFLKENNCVMDSLATWVYICRTRNISVLNWLNHHNPLPNTFCETLYIQQIDHMFPLSSAQWFLDQLNHLNCQFCNKITQSMKRSPTKNQLFSPTKKTKT